MKKPLFMFLILSTLLLVLSACGSGQLASTPAGTTTTQQPQPNCDVEGHDFSKDPDVCGKCGMNYFAATLKFTMIAYSRDGYILMGTGTCDRTEIVVPETYKNKPVKEISNNAFKGKESIRVIILPDTVKTIGGNAFCGCPDLEVLVIGSGVENIDHDVLINSPKCSQVFYHGTEAQWKQIEIVGKNPGYGFSLGGNKELLEATIYFYSETPPTQPGNYWRYVDGVPTPWETQET